MTDIVDRLNDSLSAGYSELRKEAAAEITRLRAKIEQLERQEPVAIAKWTTGGVAVHLVGDVRPGDILYLAPGAQPTPSVPVDVITDYLVSISAHIAHQDDTKAQAEIGELLKLIAAAPEAK